ncbi:MAG: hypothetical protein VCB25_12395, partial [Myxococcota bacterium]
MNAGTTIDVTPPETAKYDFDRLEHSIEFLMKEHERLTGEREALVSELVDREHRIATLESRLEIERGKRKTAIEGVEQALGRLENLRASVKVHVETSD